MATRREQDEAAQELWHGLRRSARVLAIRGPQGYAEMAVHPDDVYTVIPRGARMVMPRGQRWWAAPHSHLRRGVEVVFWKPAQCCICLTKQRGTYYD